MKKKAFITGINGQDGAYLSRILLEKDYEVHGVIRRSSWPNTQRIDEIFDPESKAFIHYADLGDASIAHAIYKVKPDEIYNLGAMSHVRISFDIPEYTGLVTALGATRILEAIRQGIKLGILSKDIKYYQASSSEMFGDTLPPQSETTVFSPQSPYGCAKLYAYHMTKVYRKGYGMFASNGILFNHESPLRGVNFVTRKITRATARIKLGLQKQIVLGNLDALRDWGHSKDYMRAVWMILQHDQPDDFVVSTGQYYTVRQFLVRVFNYFGLDYKDFVKYDETYLRPNEVPALLGDSTKIRQTLKWEPEYDFDKLVEEMCREDFEIEKAEAEKRKKV